ncbi:MAG: hypothetical protein WD294_01795 [Phycisphaeraceae bacterium]
MTSFYWVDLDDAWSDRDATKHPREVAGEQVDDLPPTLDDERGRDMAWQVGRSIGNCEEGTIYPPL